MASHYLISPAASRFSSTSPLFLPSSRSLRTNLWCQRFKNRLSVSVPLENARFGVRSLESTASPGGAGEAAAKEAAVTQEDLESQRLFEKLKDLEQQRIDKLEKFENKANLQLERQLVMASCWSRALLTLQGKLKGTEWDPENSHRIDFSEFWSLLNSNNVQFMEYSNFGQSISGIDGRRGERKENSNREIVYRRHIVDQMPIDVWNDVWSKLHQQLVNIDVINVDTVSAEVYSTIAIAVVWSMRLALSIAIYLWVDSVMRPIYAKLIPCDLGTPMKKVRMPLKHDTLGSLGKSRAKFISAEETTGVTFDDFAGQDYIKLELQEIVRILKNDKEFQDKGIYCPKGVLLHGPPGTGKTLLAKAIAGEAGLPFFAANGTDFVEVKFRFFTL
ncbi:hypothetical protein BHE74_00022343 [Ensete ventricosum]|nr:hypothetical protein GW17_00043582 [Ensete ventricosum]RWW70015.1 hypothetical protein BHE74_00022343 [Ensete ventricosum]RZR86897.1 hypothetical protein BHM03_00014178 [Ensete ventricosum]